MGASNTPSIVLGNLSSQTGEWYLRDSPSLCRAWSPPILLWRSPPGSKAQLLGVGTLGLGGGEIRQSLGPLMPNVTLQPLKVLWEKLRFGGGPREASGMNKLSGTPGRMSSPGRPELSSLCACPQDTLTFVLEQDVGQDIQVTPTRCACWEKAPSSVLGITHLRPSQTPIQAVRGAQLRMQPQVSLLLGASPFIGRAERRKKG